jgi:hypothetical protein
MLAPVLDELVPIEVPDLLSADVAHKCRKSLPWLAARWFPRGALIGYMKINQVTESVQAGEGQSVGRQSPVDRDLGLARPFLGVVTAGTSRSRGGLSV